MDLYRIIDTLIAERNRIDRMIQSFDANDRTRRKPPQPPDGGRGPGGRPGRKSMDDGARRDVSERMKRYWSRRREEEAGNAAAASDAALFLQVPGVRREQAR